MGLRPRTVRRSSAALAALAVAIALLAGCGHRSEALTVTVTPRGSLMDEPLAIRVSGAPPGATTTVTVESTDARDVAWRSSATYRASSRGEVDAAKDPSLDGTYTGVAGTGLVWSMRPVGKSDVAYYWRQAPSTFTVTARAGTSTGSTTFRRGVTTRPLVERSPSLASDGFIGRYVSKPVTDGTRPAVLLIGGSEGGLNPLLPAMLAVRGYPSLAVAYFRAPGLGSTLSAIPLEYFERALTWLAAQPGVDPSRIVVMGGSRGSEAAELLGVHDPDQVHGVIATSPSDVVGCAYPKCDGPAWTLGGAPVPYTRALNDPHPSDVPQAVIPLAQIRGPVLMVCGEEDRLWASCDFSRAAMAALDADPSAPPHELVAVPGVGHYIAEVLPGEAEVAPSEITPAEHAAVELALPDVWRHVLAYLAALR